MIRRSLNTVSLCIRIALDFTLEASQDQALSHQMNTVLIRSRYSSVKWFTPQQRNMESAFLGY